MSHVITCAHCGELFDVKHKSAKYCSRKCGDRASYERKLAKGPRCPICGGPHWAQGKDPRPMCNKCYANKRGQGVTWNGLNVTCRDCGISFPNSREKKESHCAQCKNARMKASAASRGLCVLEGCESPQFCKGWCNRHYWEQHHGHAFTFPVSCYVCNEPLAYTRRNREDGEAGVHNKCKPEKLYYVTPRERYAIYQRDEFTCQICDKPVERHRGEWTPWTASLDHIVPRSASDEPDHSRKNLRTCHSICNTIRGAGALTDSEVVEKLKEWEAANA